MNTTHAAPVSIRDLAAELGTTTDVLFEFDPIDLNVATMDDDTILDADVAAAIREAWDVETYGDHTDA